jgi:2-oxo-4-hydroxy-4-carboxy-5-ureidoimidazoline decarboxylase
VTLQELNALPAPAAVAELLKCCGSSRWARAVAARRPFVSPEGLLAAGDEEWARCGRADILEAFSHHPRIGGKDALRAKFAATRGWSQGEQSTVARASEETLDGLAAGNAEYEKRFGYIFIVCATGKSAEEMLELLRARLPNAPEAELEAAAAEQAKITRLRLAKLLAGS